MATDLNTGLGVDFQDGLQRGLINDRGLEVIHEVGISCTCRVDDPYASTLNDGKDSRRDAFCERCGQDGFIYRSPRLITAMITGVKHQRNILDAGNYHPGDAQLSTYPEDDGCGEANRRIGAFDKITATWPEPVDDGHVIVRGAGANAALQGVNTELESNEDRLWYEPANSIWCEDENDVVYEEDADFVLGPGKIIRWIGNQPKEGIRYSIKYNAYFEWIVWQPPGERRDRNADNLGELIYLRKRHVIFVNTSPYAASNVRESISAKSCVI